MRTVRKTTIIVLKLDQNIEFSFDFQCFHLFPHQYVAYHATAIVEIYSEDQSSSALTEYKEALQQHRTYLTPLKLLPNTRLLCQKRIFCIEKMIG